ncbi:MAG: GerAB/ArcD/ProY family transporter [Bacillota bacterium]
MPDEARISRWQLNMVWIGFLIGSSTLVVPASSAGRDVWISALIGGALGVVHAVLLLRLSARFPGRLPAEIFIRCVGRPFGAALGSLYIWYCLHLGSLVIRDAAEAHFVSAFERTPEAVVTGVMATLTVAAVYLGIEVLSRATEILAPLLILSVLVVTCLAVFTKGLLRVEAILPVMETGWVPVLKGAWANLAFPFGETAVLLSVLPYASLDKRAEYGVARSTSFVTILLTAVSLRNVMALGAAAQVLMFPSLTAVSLISIGVLIQRLDALLLFTWTFGAFIKASLCLFAVVVNLKVLLGVKDYGFHQLRLAAVLFPVRSNPAAGDPGRGGSEKVRQE